MNRIILLIISILWHLAPIQAQEYKTKLANTKDRKVTIEMEATALKIEGHNSDEVIILASSGYEIPEQAKGLKPLYNSNVDNSGIGLAVTSENGGLRIEKATRRPIKYTIKLPRKVALLFQEVNWQGSNVSISNMDGDLEIKTNSAWVVLNNVTGPVVANTVNGEIKIVYSALSQEKPTAISTINGSVDITLPANTKTNLKLRSINGEMYTDFDLGLKTAKDGMSKVGGGRDIDGTTNGGGVEMQVKTINSNIYIRKQK